MTTIFQTNAQAQDQSGIVQQAEPLHHQCRDCQAVATCPDCGGADLRAVYEHARPTLVHADDIPADVVRAMKLAMMRRSLIE